MIAGTRRNARNDSLSPLTFYSGGKVLRGLTRRRAAEGDLLHILIDFFLNLFRR